MKNMKNIFLIIIIIILIFIIYFLLPIKIIDKFNNLYTKQSCCNEKYIKYCESWGKTGVCNFDGSKSCMCLDAF
jgi:hypothetical protein